MGVEVSELPKAVAVADANGRASVGPYKETRFDSEVAEERLVPKSLACAADDAGKLCHPELKATEDCVDDQCLTAWPRSSTHPPEVLLRVFGHPAQSVSVCTSISATVC